MEEESLMQEAIKAYDVKDFMSAKNICESLSDSNTNAMVNLGSMYVKGFGMPKNIHKAYELFDKAASHGHETATTSTVSATHSPLWLTMRGAD